MIKLAELFPGAIAGIPLSPPFSASARRSSRKWLFCSAGPWQAKQFRASNGRTSRSKSTAANGIKDRLNIIHRIVLAYFPIAAITICKVFPVESSTGAAFQSFRDPS